MRRMLSTAVVALVVAGLGGAAAPPADPQAPKTADAAKLAADLTARLDAAYYSFVRKGAPGFDATFTAQRDGQAAGSVRAVWNARTGQLDLTYDGPLPEDDGDWLKQLLQIALDEALLNVFSGKDLYAVQSGENTVISDYSPAPEGTRSRTQVVSKDLLTTRQKTLMTNGDSREAVLVARDVNGKKYMASMTVAARSAGAERKAEYAFTWAVRDGVAFLRQFTIAETAGAEKTAWTLASGPPRFIQEVATVAETRPAGTGKVVKVVLKETSLGKRPAGEVPSSLVVSRDFARFASIAKEGEKQVVYTNGVKGTVYDAVTDLKFSPDGRRLVYRAKRGNEFVVVENGTEGKAYAGIGPLVFGPEGRLIYQVKVSGGMAMVLDGQAGKVYEQISEACFAPVGGLMVYMAKGSGSRFCVRNGVERASYSLISPPVFSRDGKTFAYAAKNVNEEHLIVLDTGDSQDEGPEFDQVDDATIALSPDGKRVAYIGSNGEDDDEYYVVFGGQKIGPFEWADDLVMSPDGAHVAFTAKLGLQRYVMQLDRRAAGKVYEEVKDPVFTADGRLLYAARRGQKWLIVTVGVESREYDRVSRVVLGPGGKRFAYEAELGKDRQVLVIDGVQGREFVWVSLEDLVFSPEGKHCAYTAGGHGDEVFLILDGAAKGPFERVWSIRFSPDGSRCTYQVRRNNKWRQVLDEGREGKPCDTLRTPLFSPDGKRFALVAERDKKLVLVVDEVEGEPLEGAVLRDPQFVGPSALRFLVARNDEVVLVEAMLVEQ